MKEFQKGRSVGDMAFAFLLKLPQIFQLSLFSPLKTPPYEFAPLDGKIFPENYILKTLLMKYFLKRNKVSLMTLLYSAFNKISSPDLNRICHVMNGLCEPS